MQNTRQSKQSHKHTCRTQTPSHKVTVKGQTATEINIKRKSQYIWWWRTCWYICLKCFMRTSFICCTNQISATTDSLTDGGDSLWKCQCKQVLRMLCSVTVYWKHIMLFFFLTEIKLRIVFPKKWSVYTHFNVAIFSVFLFAYLHQCTQRMINAPGSLDRWQPDCSRQRLGTHTASETLDEWFW